MIQSIATARSRQVIGAFLVIGGLAACTFQAAVKPPPAPPVAVDRKMPLAMGVYFPPEFKTFVHRQRSGATIHSLTFAVGESSATHFSRVFSRYFDRAVEFNERPTAERPAGGVDAVLIPELHELIMSAPGFVGWAGQWNTELTYKFRMFDPAGLPIATWPVEGRGSDGGVDWTGLAGSNTAGGSVNAALEDAGRNFIVTFARQPEIRNWLASRGVQISLSRGPPATDRNAE